jgi:hypothetical protein
MASETLERTTAAHVPAVPLQPVIDPAGWLPQELAASQAFLFHLSPDHVAELDRAIRGIGERGLPIMEITRADFPLPTLGPELAQVRRDIFEGRGFVQIRGFPVANYTREQAAVAFWGVSMHLAERVASQNAKGHMLGHVRDIGQTNKNADQRGPYSHDEIPFHVDCSDIVGLLCLETAKSGGESGVSSSIAVHNELLKRRPDLVRVLSEPFYRDRRGEVPPGMEPWYIEPVFNYNEGYLSTTIEPYYMRTAERHPGVPPMTPEQHEALAAVLEVAEELRLDIAFEAGDMQFLNNHVVMHTREGFKDDPAAGRFRHLLRIWLIEKNCRPLPACYFERHGKPGEVDWPGGIVGPDTVLNAPLEPV